MKMPIKIVFAVTAWLFLSVSAFADECGCASDSANSGSKYRLGGIPVFVPRDSREALAYGIPICVNGEVGIFCFADTQKVSQLSHRPRSNPHHTHNHKIASPLLVKPTVDAPTASYTGAVNAESDVQTTSVLANISRFLVACGKVLNSTGGIAAWLAVIIAITAIVLPLRGKIRTT
ncbi:MAG TPA: hypothetical protein VII56_12280 [Rhizomicrobium sp.]